MSNKLLIDGSRVDQTQIALLSNNGIEDFEFESLAKKNLKGNIYLGKVSRIEASLQAAFVEIGSEKNGFLAFGEIHPNYFQIPVADREALLKAEAEAEDIHNEETEKLENLNNGNFPSQIDDDSLQKNGDDLGDGSLQNNFVEKNKDNRKKNNFRKKLLRSYKIQEVIKAGQLILVQVVKEERGNKGAALTSYISLAGKYSVLMPNSTKIKGISRKISTSDDRNKLKKIVEDLKIPSEMGLIIRTAGLNKTKNEIRKDYITLNKLWIGVVESTKKAIAPALIHEEGNLLRRVVRDVYSKDMKEVIVEGSEAYKETKKYMSQVLPSCTKYVKQYKNKVPIFTKYDVENEILKMFEPEVKLKSGGYIVINPTEALVAIDVNSGGATKERNIEKTALKTNLEAAEEIAKQLKIRDLSGLIVIDFIDMYEIRNNRTIEKKIRELLKKDRARIQTSRISQFGLLEMSRQRLRQSFIDWKTELSDNSVALKVIYKIKAKINSIEKKDIQIVLNPLTLKAINEIQANAFDDLSNKSKINIEIKEDQELSLDTVEFKNIKEAKKKLKRKTSTATKTVKKKKKKSSKIKQAKNKAKEIKIDTTLKEIKDKKSGWWQK